MPRTRMVASALVLLAALLIPLAAFAGGGLNADLLRAARAGDTAAVQALIAKGADVNAKLENVGRTVLMGAIFGGHTSVVSFLLDAGADVNVKDKNGSTVLMRAAEGGDTTTVRTLLGSRADVNTKDKKGTTALMKAAGVGSTEIVRALLNAGADVHAKDRDGATALMVAGGGMNRHTVGALLDGGAEVNAKNKDGETALMKAADKGYIEIIIDLLRAGAEVNAKDKGGRTALMKSAMRGHGSAVSFLLRGNPDVNAKDNEGKTALMEAKRGGYYGIVQLLKEAGAEDVLLQRLVTASTRFGFRLFAEVAKEDSGKNTFLSPSSVAIALSMTYNGAKGETRQAMAKTLKLQGMNLEEVSRASAALLASLKSPDPKVQLAIANSLWLRKDIEFRQEFLRRNAKFYGAEIANLDFSAPDAAPTINYWVSRKTNEKIKEIVGREIADAIMILINAIYFKGQWTVEFDKKKTKERMFTLLDGTQKKHPMMSQSGRYLYYRGENFQAVSLPYGEKRVSMYIFLPDKDSSLEEFRKHLTAGNWESWMSLFREEEGKIVLPRFKAEYEVELKDTLKALGMDIAFDPKRANFDGMTPVFPGKNVYIEIVKHKTFVEVNEEGTEAAAVTAVVPRETGVIKRFTMIVNRPFFCAIRDNKTGTVLFMGYIVEPK